jgi:hypothetical protein
MDDHTRYLTDGVRKFSSILHAFEAGHTVEEVRNVVLGVLRQEFRNAEVLERYGIDLLTVEATNISKLKRNAESYKLFRLCMELRTSQLLANEDLCARICSEWEQEIAAGLRLYWNAARFEIGKTDLPLDEFAYEVLRNIGSVLEATMLPYLRELLHLQEAHKGNQLLKADVLALDFGVVVSRLESELGADVLRPKPWNLPLNQWRNIAQHFSVESDAEVIRCRYGKGNKYTLELRRNDLWDALVAIFSTYSALRTSHAIFFLDNGDALAAHCKGFDRKDSDLQFQFVVGAASQGFEVTSLSVAKELSVAVLRDCTTGEPTARGVHASQFVLGLWRATKSEKVEIEYITKSGVKHLRAGTLGSACALVDSGEQDMRYLAEVVQLSLISPDSGEGAGDRS